MKLIKKIGRNATNKRYYGLFECKYCKSIVKKEMNIGRKSKSCGCMRNTLIGDAKRKHGVTGTRLHHMWSGMKTRCYNKNNSNYKVYGERGIFVCDEWKNDFVSFQKWAIDNGYTEATSIDITIDRINGNDGYHPGNCQFITRGANSMKTRNTKLDWEKINTIRSEYKAGGVSHSQLASIFGVTRPLIGYIVNNKSWEVKNQIKGPTK